MSPARAKSFSFIALVSAVALLGVLLFAPLPLGRSTVSGMALRDGLHFPLFALLLALCYAALLRIQPPPTRRRALLLAIFATCTLAAASEWTQSLTSRTASWQDLLHNLLGIAAASLAIVAAWFRNSRSFPGWLLLTAGVWAVSITLVARPAVRALTAERRQANSFPLLGDFEDGLESLVWIPQGQDENRATRVEVTNAHATRGSHSLEIQAQGARWAGVRVLFGKPLPWPESASLRFDIFNPGEAFNLGVRLDGFDGRRFSSEVRIAPGPNQCSASPDQFAGSAPLTPPFAPRIIVFHLGESPATNRFYLDNVRLE